MPRHTSGVLVGATIGGALLIFFNTIVLDQVRVVYAPGQQIRTSLFNQSARLHEFMGYMGQWKRLAGENQDLESRLEQNVVNEVRIEILEKENDLLQKSLGLAAKIDRHLIPAGLFSLTLTPDGYNAIINKGLNHGIEANNIVVGPDGVMVGRVETVFATSSRITLVSDPSFKVTVRVLGGEARGIAKGALGGGMILELIVQTDEVTEGDTLISTGDDTTSAGLIIGTISNVQNNEGQLFKKVKITPAMNFSNGAVLVIQ